LKLLILFTENGKPKTENGKRYYSGVNMDEPKIKELEDALKERETGHYVLRLYVAGLNRLSLRAIENLRKICEENLEGRYELEVIDIYQQPVLAQGGQIIAAPTLIKQLPPPLRKFIGDLSQTEKILVGLDLRPK
jgi:circadian clock protein KaiB